MAVDVSVRRELDLCSLISPLSAHRKFHHIGAIDFVKVTIHSAATSSDARLALAIFAGMSKA
jgi:hypothetical protein